MQCTQMIEYKKLESNAQNTEGWTHTLILNKSFSVQLMSFAPLSANHWPPVGHKPLLDHIEHRFSSPTSWWNRTPTR